MSGIVRRFKMFVVHGHGLGVAHTGSSPFVGRLWKSGPLGATHGRSADRSVRAARRGRPVSCGRICSCRPTLRASRRFAPAAGRGDWPVRREWRACGARAPAPQSCGHDREKPNDRWSPRCCRARKRLAGAPEPVKFPRFCDLTPSADGAQSPRRGVQIVPRRSRSASTCSAAGGLPVRGAEAADVGEKIKQRPPTRQLMLTKVT